MVCRKDMTYSWGVVDEMPGRCKPKVECVDPDKGGGASCNLKHSTELTVYGGVPVRSRVLLRFGYKF